jgi:hypothetical protein
MPISTEMIVRVAHADIAMHMAFPKSVAHWHSTKDKDRPWKVLPTPCDAILIGKDDGVAIDGDCSNRVSAPDGGLIHIYGDLASHVDVDGHYEVLITGDVAANGTIEASGYCHVFVGGRFPVNSVRQFGRFGSNPISTEPSKRATLQPKSTLVATTSAISSPRKPLHFFG